MTVLSIEEISNSIFDFASNTVLGQESGLYKTISRIVPAPEGFPTDLKMLQSPIILSFYSKSIVSYLNNCYRALILKNDDYIVSKFNMMGSHSKICLLNIVASIIKFIFDNINRNMLKIENYESFMNSLKYQHENFKRIFMPNIIKLMCHQCNGEDIEKCNPGKDMFHV